VTAYPERLTAPGPKRVLSIDGGGMRGALAIGILQVLEQRLREREGRPDLRLCDWFDLIGGTSTGAIIAAGLALGHDCAEIERLYRTLGPRVFIGGYRIPFLQSRFDPRKLEREIAGYLGDVTLGNAPWKTGFAALAKRVDTGSAWVLTNNPRARYWLGDPEEIAAQPDAALRRVVPNHEYRLARIVQASAAAPFYFDIVPIEVEKGSPGAFLDGAMTSHNNPALMLAMVAGVPAYGFAWPYGADELTVVSVGTGSARPRSPAWLRRRLTLPAVKAVAGLTSALYDSSQQANALMQWLGRSPRPWSINSEIGTLAGARHGFPPMWTFQRYDAPLEEAWLKRELDLSLGEAKLLRLRLLDNVGDIDLLLKIGALAGERQVDAQLFG
jgi:predicted acylesterase/phospholipase RssA